MGRTRSTYGAVQKCIAYRVLVGKLEEKRPLGRPRRRWKDNIKMELMDVDSDYGHWITPAEDREQW